MSLATVQTHHAEPRTITAARLARTEDAEINETFLSRRVIEGVNRDLRNVPEVCRAAEVERERELERVDWDRRNCAERFDVA